jgi:16S rRNA (cytosine1402-N4)-methyltransferase
MSEPHEPKLHRPVLLDECLAALGLVGQGLGADGVSESASNGVFLDATFGRGGHSAAILEHLGPKARLLALDRDPQAIQFAREQSPLRDDPRFSIAHSRFSQLADALDRAGVEQIDGALFDLGVSSPQLDQAERGFSFKNDGPLDMRMDPTHGQSVREWLLAASETDITEVLKRYGEERLAFQIAKAIVTRCRNDGESALQTTGELARLVAGVIISRKGRSAMGKDPATRSFQALRIYINQEFEELEAGLVGVLNRLAPGGRLAVISFHSLEDRIVKQFLNQHSLQAAPRHPVTGVRLPSAALQCEVFKKVMPSDLEKDLNPRARSAVLRSAMRLRPFEVEDEISKIASSVGELKLGSLPTKH